MSEELEGGGESICGGSGGTRDIEKRIGEDQRCGRFGGVGGQWELCEQGGDGNLYSRRGMFWKGCVAFSLFVKELCLVRIDVKFFTFGVA